MKWLKWSRRSGYSGKHGFMLDEIEALLVVIGSCLQQSGPHAMPQLACPTPGIMGEKAEPCQEQSHQMSDFSRGPGQARMQGPHVHTTPARSRGQLGPSHKKEANGETKRLAGATHGDYTGCWSAMSPAGDGVAQTSHKPVVRRCYKCAAGT